MTGSGALRVKLRFDFDPRASSVLADRIQLQQVVANLMRNAIEAMAEQTRRELTVSSVLVDSATSRFPSPTQDRAWISTCATASSSHS